MLRPHPDVSTARTMRGVALATAAPALAGDGSFAGFEPPVLYDLPSFANTVRAGDLDADGDIDLVFAHPGGDSVSILFNNGDGTFEPGPDMLVAIAMEDTAITDFDGDGIVDIIAVSSSSPVGEPFDAIGRVAILRGLGGGVFDEPAFFFAGTQPVGVAAGDLNGDGHPDFAVTNQLSDDVAVFLNNGDGTPQAPVFYQAGNVPVRVTITDMDLDGDLDIVVVNRFSDNISVFLNDGHGQFQSLATVDTTFFPLNAAVGDINGDGLPDVALATGSAAAVAVHLNQGGGALSEHTLKDAGISNSSIGLARINTDDVLDAIPAGRHPPSTGTPSMKTIFGDGLGQFPTMSPILSLSGGNSLPLHQTEADLDMDGDIDVAIIVGFQVSILLNKTNSRNAIDLTGDGVIDGADLSELLRAWGRPGAADFDQSGAVDGRDLAHLLANWTLPAPVAPDHQKGRIP